MKLGGLGFEIKNRRRNGVRQSEQTGHARGFLRVSVDHGTPINGHEVLLSLNVQAGQGLGDKDTREQDRDAYRRTTVSIMAWTWVLPAG